MFNVRSEMYQVKLWLKLHTTHFRIQTHFLLTVLRYLISYLSFSINQLSCVKHFFSSYLPAANEVCEGYAFTGVCLFTGGGYVWRGRGVVVWGLCMVGGMHGWGHAWRGRVHGQGHAWQGGMHGVANTTGYGQWAGGTHPTGMHSCFFSCFHAYSDLS